MSESGVTTVPDPADARMQRIAAIIDAWLERADVSRAAFEQGQRAANEQLESFAQWARAQTDRATQLRNSILSTFPRTVTDKVNADIESGVRPLPPGGPSPAEVPRLLNQLSSQSTYGVVGKAAFDLARHIIDVWWAVREASRLEYERGASIHQSTLAALQAEQSAAQTAATAELRSALQQVEPFPVVAVPGTGPLTAQLVGTVPWDRSEIWSAWEPVTDLPRQIVLGHATLGTAFLERIVADDPRAAALVHAGFGQPVTWSVPGDRSLRLLTDQSGRDEAVSCIQSVVFRLLLSMPPGRARLTFVDPVSRSHNVAAFMNLQDYEQAVVARRALTEEADIDAALQDLASDMERIIQERLRNRFANLEDYNDAGVGPTEPYQFLVVFDYPAAFNEQSIHRLTSIAEHGARCGIYVIVLQRSDISMPRFLSDRPAPHPGLTLGHVSPEGPWMIGGEVELERLWAGVAGSASDLDLYQSLRRVPGAPPVSRWAVELDRAPDLSVDETAAEPNLFTRMIQSIGSKADELHHETLVVPLDAIVPEELWTETSQTELAVPVGLSGTQPFRFVLGDQPAHALVIGGTGAGKTTLFHALIHSAAARYSPEELELWLVDMRHGVEFNDAYVPTETNPGLPHTRVVAGESDAEFTLAVLEALVAEVGNRSERISRVPGARNLTQFRERTGEPMPRILAIIDEFQLLFHDVPDANARKAWEHLNYLAKDARFVGIHLVLGTQTLMGIKTSAHSVAEGTLGQIHLRVALRCHENDSAELLGTKDAAELPGKGAGLAEQGLPGSTGLRAFQTAFGDPDAQLLLRRRIAAAVPATSELRQPFVLRSRPLPIRDSLAVAHPEANQKVVGVALGRAIAFSDEERDLSALIGNRKKRSLLIVGGGATNEALAAGVVAGASMSFRAARPDARILFVNGLWGASPLIDAIDALADAVGASMADPDEAEKELTELAAAIDAGDAPPTLVVGLALEALEAKVTRPGSPGNPVGDAFMSILERGPAAGVLTVSWWDSVRSLQAALHTEGLNLYGCRVVLDLAPEDVSTLAGTRARTGRDRALFWDAGQVNEPVRFVPFAPPDEEDFRWFRDQVEPDRRDSAPVDQADETEAHP